MPSWRKEARRLCDAATAAPRARCRGCGDEPGAHGEGCDLVEESRSRIEAQHELRSVAPTLLPRALDALDVAEAALAAVPEHMHAESCAQAEWDFHNGGKDYRSHLRPACDCHVAKVRAARALLRGE